MEINLPKPSQKSFEPKKPAWGKPTMTLQKKSG